MHVSSLKLHDLISQNLCEKMLANNTKTTLLAQQCILLKIDFKSLGQLSHTLSLLRRTDF